MDTHVAVCGAVKRTLAKSLFGLVLLGGVLSAHAQQVKVMQYNVQGHIGNILSNNTPKAQALARIINFTQPDIITFCELEDNGTIQTVAGVIDWVTNNVPSFGNQTGVTFWVDIASVGDGFIRNGAISRYPISGAVTYSDAGGGYFELRGMESFTVQLSGTNALEIFHAHLKCCSDGNSCPEKQSEAAADATNMMVWASVNSYPYVWTCDCNEDEDPRDTPECPITSDYAPMTTLESIGGLAEYEPTTLTGAKPLDNQWRTWSSESTPSIRFDYVLAATNRLSPVSGFVFSTGDWASHGLYTNIVGSGNLINDSQLASDHYNVMAVYQLPTAGTTNFAVSPTSFAWNGTPGGPFLPTGQICVLTNFDVIPLFWAATNTASWLSLSARTGNLGAGWSTNITASITAAANSLTLGTYTDTITFSNTATGVSFPVGVTLVVAPPTPPVASFTASPTNGVAPLTVTFTDTSSGSITDRFWSFGDGNTTNTANYSVVHTYAAGTDTVMFVVTGPVGASTNTHVNLITVGPAPIYTIGTSSSPAGGGTTTGGGSYANGTVATVAALPNACNAFVNWTEGATVVSTFPSYTFTVSTNRNLVANFVAVPSYTITTSNSPASGGSSSGGGTVACESNVTVCATANSCYTFANWTLGSNVVSASACYSFAAVSNEALVANFTLNGSPTNGNLIALWEFTGGNDGANPYSAMVLGNDGNYYGTTVYGGSRNYGAVFRMRPDGTVTNFHSFNGNDGAYPIGGLMQGSDGNLYGTTYAGGAGGWDGTVFRISAAGTLTTLHAFSGSDGQYLYDGVVQGNDGDFYGTTIYGGANGKGTVFRVTPGGSSSNLWSFTGGVDGEYPYSGLVQGGDGNFYGTTFYGGSHGYGTVFRIAPGGSLSNLWSFTYGVDGAYAYSGLAQGGDGNFYGTTLYGGSHGYGTVFRITPSGSLSNLWSFTGGLDGSNPYSALLQGSDGGFYGTTYNGGANGYGTMFRITRGGSLSNLWAFTGCRDGANPHASLIQGGDGNFYGSGQGGGANNDGALFEIKSGLSVYRVITSTAPSGAGFTSGNVIVAPGSNVTVCAAPYGCYGFTDWRLNGAVVSTSACYTFTPTTNESLVANFALVTDTITTTSSPPAGGSTSGGGNVQCGSLATVCASANSCYNFVNWTVNGTPVSTSPCYLFGVPSNETLVANFTPIPRTITVSNSPAGGGSASGGGTVDCGSNVTLCATPNPCYGFVGWTLNGNQLSTSPCFSFTANANATWVANFALVSGTITTSSSPTGGGSTSGGGTVTCGSNVTVCAMANSCYSFVNWTLNGDLVSTSPCYTFTATSNQTLVANFTPISYGSSSSNSLTSLWAFTSDSDGAYPIAGLVQGSDGDFYGTTPASGSGSSAYGTVFRITPGGSLTNLWSFGNGIDGANPYAPLVQARDGSFYGTTLGYGSGPSANGTVFRIMPSGNLTNLWSFGNGVDGANPYAPLVQARDGSFYGTTFGSGSGPSANGTVFRIMPSGSLTTLHSFGGSDGVGPAAGLVQGADGDFYGTTSYGGTYGYGTVFRITPGGSLSNLWSFGNGLDGANPDSPLVRGGDDNLYGTTYGSGSGPSAHGTVFRITPGGSLSNLWAFNGCGDGANPSAGLVQGSDGNFYGTTVDAGMNGYGTVFRIDSSGSLTTLWTFTNSLDGAYSYAALIQGSDGSFYGAPNGGMYYGYGGVFRLVVPLHPRANQISAIQVGGTDVVLTLPTVAGETYQLQYSASLIFSNWMNVVGASITNSIGGPLSLTNFGGAMQPQRFYRFDITP